MHVVIRNNKLHDENLILSKFSVDICFSWRIWSTHIMDNYTSETYHTSKLHILCRALAALWYANKKGNIK